MPSDKDKSSKEEKRAEAEIKALINRREHEFRSMQILYDLSKEVQKDMTKYSKFNARFKKIETLRQNFLDIDYEINTKKLESELDSQLDTNTLSAFDDLYFSVIEFAESLEEDSSNSVIAHNPTQKNQVRLPKIQLPTFDGNVENWQTFKDSYLPLIHQSQSLSEIEKFHYLISSLSGFALTIAKGVPLTAANYQVVYSALVDRYDNKRVLATTYLDKVFKLTPSNKPTFENLTHLTNTLYESVNALRALEIGDSLSEFILFYLSSRALDNDTRQRFELQNIKELPTFNDLLNFLQNYIKILEVSKPTSANTKPISTGIENINRRQIRNNKPNYSPHRKTFITSHTDKPLLCPCCKAAHSIYKCIKIQTMDIASRRKLINDLNLCPNCLRAGHKVVDCRSRTNCLICNSRHNTLLHVDVSTSGAPTPSSSVQIAPSENRTASLTSAVTELGGRRTIKILGSAIVRIKDRYDSEQYARALIDSCSMDSFITTSCARRLGLPIRKCRMSVTGLGQNSVQDIRGVTNCTIMPRYNETPRFDIPLVVLPKITSSMPSTPCPPSIREHFKHLELADDNFDKPGPIDLLLGVECFDQIYDGQRYAPSPGFPCALSSVFGWVITGQCIDRTSMRTPAQPVTSLIASTCALDDIVQRFWETEEPPKAHISVPEDDICEQIYQQKTYRTTDGRYVVPIMLKENAPPLGDSYSRSLNRFLNLEKRLARQPELRAEYVQFMRQYEDLGHMQPIESSSTAHTYIIPHHCVVRPSSSTTRLRVVFDASCHTTNNNSLNDIVHVGPKLQIDIIDLITKFRLHAIVFTADICKMYRQILIQPEDRSYQHILWRETPDSPLKEYELNTVTYGVSSSPYLAIRTLRQLANDNNTEFPRAAQVLCEETFMDDITTGCSSYDEAIQLRNDLISLLKLGKFELRKWSSNVPELLADFPPDHCQHPKLFSEPKEESTLKILGIKWDPLSDHFSYSFSDNFNIEFTKRAILSIIARIFDPLGWISPIIISAKLLLQEMWRLNLSWEEPIPNNLAKQWHMIAANLIDLQTIKLPRMILPQDHIQVHLVGFCDGSSKGYGCCVYLYVITPHLIKASLLIGKSRVAPLKPLTVNRLELSAAVLLARVLNHVHHLLKTKVNIDSVTAFSDSSTVLSWLNTPPHLLKMFVANRVVQTTDLIPSDSWYHVSTHDNPADCCSRGTTCAELASHKLWWSGPSWLAQPRTDWPSQREIVPPEELPELKSLPTQSLITQSNEFTSELISKFSSFIKLQRTFAWCLRFINNLKCKPEIRNLTPLTTLELERASVILIRHVQHLHFQEEFNQIEKNLPCRKFIQKLSPFIDGEGLLRVGGRLRHSNLSDSKIHPILLPKSCSLSLLLIDYFHKKYFHCGPRALQSLIQRKYWILGLRLLIRSYVSKCIVCFKAKPVPCQPIMGDLPSVRFQTGRCFRTVGIDFGGPFIVKESKRRNARTYKAYICLFVCLSVKAIHLEAVTELSTEAFLAALDRFVSRRGMCHKIITDHGTNFVGANKHLNDVYNLLSKNHADIANNLVNRHIIWEFNPPGAPHFGGIFESGIKSTKYHLQRVVGSQVLTLEEMFTVLTKIEAILNSRPLCAFSSDPTEIDVLTPGHFLTGGPIVSLPEVPYIDSPFCPRSRWQMLQKITQSFWRVWQRDYLHTLQQRSKWFQCKPNIKVNDVVVVVEPNLPPLQWKLATVEQIYPGHDGVVRVVTIRTANGHTFRRPVVKICPLPL